MFSNPIHWALDENSNLPVSHAWRNPGWQIVLLEKHHVTCWLFMSPISHVRQKPVSYRLTHSKCCFPFGPGSETLFTFCYLPELTEEGSAVSVVLLPSRGGCLQIPKLSWSSSVAPAIPTISPFLLAFTLPRLADVRWNPARQFPLFKDSSV